MGSIGGISEIGYCKQQKSRLSYLKDKQRA